MIVTILFPQHDNPLKIVKRINNNVNNWQALFEWFDYGLNFLKMPYHCKPYYIFCMHDNKLTKYDDDIKSR